MSTVEAEYIALSLSIQEGKWIHRLLCKILNATGEKGPELKFFEDNQSCIKMIKNHVNHDRSKPIDIKYHQLCDEIKRGGVYLKRCETPNILVAIMKKETYSTASQRQDCNARSLCEFALKGRIKSFGFQITYTTKRGLFRTTV